MLSRLSEMLSMKWWITIGIVVIVLGLGLGLGLWLGLGGAGAALSSPTATVSSWFNAAEAKNAEKMADCWYFASDAEHTAFINSVNASFATVDSISGTNRNITVISQTDTTATVRASYHLKIVLTAGYGGGTTESDETETYALQKHDGNWLIHNIY